MITSFSLMRAAVAAALTICGAPLAYGQTELVQNGDFEQGTAHWTPGFDSAPVAGSSGGTAGVFSAPWTLTPFYGGGTVLTPIDGSSQVMALVSQLASLETRDWQWVSQNVTIPADATTGTLKADIGILHKMSIPHGGNTGVGVGIFGPTGRPFLDTQPINPSARILLGGADSTGLTTQTVSPLDLTAFRGQTLRVVLFATTDALGGSVVGTADNVSLVVNSAGGTPAPTPAPPSMIMALLGMGGVAAGALKRKLSSRK